MTDEEKQSIAFLRFYVSDEDEYFDRDYCIDKNIIETILNLIDKQRKEIKELNISDASKEQSSMDYYNLYKELEDKIKARIEKLEDMYNELPENPKEHLHSKTEYRIVIGELQSLLEKE